MLCEPWAVRAHKTNARKARGSCDIGKLKMENKNGSITTDSRGSMVESRIVSTRIAWTDIPVVDHVHEEFRRGRRAVMLGCRSCNLVPYQAVGLVRCGLVGMAATQAVNGPSCLAIILIKLV